MITAQLCFAHKKGFVVKRAKRDENIDFYLFIKIKGVELPLKNKIKYPT